MNIKYDASDSNIHISDSYKIRKRDFSSVFSFIQSEHPDNLVLKKRSWCHMSLEWCCHNFLYTLGIKRDHTRDVDLDYPQERYMKVLYAVCGALCWIFTR